MFPCPWGPPGTPRCPVSMSCSSPSSMGVKGVTLTPKSVPRTAPGLPLYWSQCKVTDSSWHLASITHHV